MRRNFRCAVVRLHPTGGIGLRLSPEFIQTIQRLKGNERVSDEISRSENPGIIGRPLRQLLSPVANLSRCKVLDLGCGTGASSVALARIGVQEVVGLDVWTEALEAARLRARDCGVQDRITFAEQHDTTRLGVPASAFDLVVLNAVLEHVLPWDRQQLMADVWRVVRPGGFVCISETPNARWPIESHTTKLIGLPYLPAPLALRCAKLAGRIPVKQTMHEALTRGFRGVSLRQILGGLPRHEVRICNDTEQYDSIANYFKNRRVRSLFQCVAAPWAALGGQPAGLLPVWRLLLRKAAT